ncbi:MAG: hypothetical protein KKA73_03555 [Chloroflexi bacterium]|nr:hypothetical protein [Chloroflexota bacterium]MBU1746740.1 hypothetical protein [Chloroflexota bacterium]
MAEVLKSGKKRVSWSEALRELAATLADAWAGADLRGHLASWWAVTTGATRVD